jgi:hypothetical protein
MLSPPPRVNQSNAHKYLKQQATKSLEKQGYLVFTDLYRV